MNNRIEELIRECEDFGDWETVRYTFDKEKFAELIVRECIKLAEADEDRYLEMGEPDLALAMQNYQAMIKQHFGVEE